MKTRFGLTYIMLLLAAIAVLLWASNYGKDYTTYEMGMVFGAYAVIVIELALAWLIDRCFYLVIWVPKSEAKHNAIVVKKCPLPKKQEEDAK